MSGYNRQGNRFVSGQYDGKFKQTNTHWKPKTKIVTEGSLDSVSSSQNYNSSISGECVVNDVASNVENVKLDDNDDCSNIKKQIGEEAQGKADGDKNLGDKDDSLNKMRFDICPKRVSRAVKLKAPLHVLNKEKRKQSKCAKGNIILGPGMVHMKGYISIDDQISIVKTCRELGISDGGFYQPGYRDGTKLHLKMMCLGKNWDPESKLYSETRSVDNAKPPAIPEVFHDLVKKALQDSNAGALIPSMVPDICIVNFYSKSGKLGLHQDKDESEESLKKGLPVVSFSIGDSAEFLHGETRNIDDAEKVILESGDVLIFGGKSRLKFHGVTSILPDTAPTSLIEATDMCPGRLNLTFRSTAINSPDDYLCVCGQRMYVRTSWTDENPGRRFVECPKMKTVNCKRFRFIDEELPPHYKKLLYELRSESFNGGIDDQAGVEVKQGQLVGMTELTFQELTLKYYDRSMLLMFSIIVMLCLVIGLLVSK